MYDRGGTSSVKRPSTSLVVPISGCPFTMMVAPMMLSPCSSDTMPRMRRLPLGSTSSASSVPAPGTGCVFTGSSGMGPASCWAMRLPGNNSAATRASSRTRDFIVLLFICFFLFRIYRTNARCVPRPPFILYGVGRRRGVWKWGNIPQSVGVRKKNIPHPLPMSRKPLTFGAIH